MNTDRIDQRLSPIGYALLVEAAKARALQARREAIDAFWSSVEHHVANTWAWLRRGVSQRRPQRTSWV